MVDSYKLVVMWNLKSYQWSFHVVMLKFIGLPCILSGPSNFAVSCIDHLARGSQDYANLQNVDMIH